MSTKPPVPTPGPAPQYIPIPGPSQPQPYTPLPGPAPQYIPTPGPYQPYALTPPSPYGAFATVDGLGGVAAPLLAGFALTLLGLVLQIDKQLRWPDPVLVLLSLAFVLFLQVVQLNARAKGYAVTPAQVREWYPDAETLARQEQIARELADHQQCWHRLVTRARNRYNLGIVILLIGAALMLVPRGPGALTWVRVVALLVLCVGVVLELIELLGDRRASRKATGPANPPPSFPAAPANPPPSFPAVPDQPAPTAWQSPTGT